MSESARRPRPGQQQSYVVALLGEGLDTTLTPALHEREADVLGLRYIYKTVDIRSSGSTAAELGGLLATAATLGMAGLNVTHPYKKQVLPLLDELVPDAAAIGAVNTVVFENGRAIGHNTDWAGFAQSLRSGLPDVDLDHVVVLGAGGAGAAVTYALLNLDAGHVVVSDLRRDYATALADSLQRRFGSKRVSAVNAQQLPDVIARTRGLVNATPAGMSGRPDLPVPAEVLRTQLWVADVVYRPMDTPLLTVARSLGCRTLTGGGMAVFQAAHAFRLFTGVVPDAQRMGAHFDALYATTDAER